MMERRIPTREEVLSDLRADVAQIEADLAERRDAGKVSGFLDRVMFAEKTPADLERKRKEILETIAIVEEDYQPGESVPIP